MIRHIAPTLLLAIGAAAISAACGNSGGTGNDAGLPADSGSSSNPDATMPGADASPSTDSGPGTDAANGDASSGDAAAGDATIGADGGSPNDGSVRSLVQVKLFGDMPLDNAVLDPQFDLSSQNWYAIGGFAGGNPTRVRVQHQEWALTPVGMPTMLVPARATDPLDSYVMGSVMAVAAPLEVSIWIGRYVPTATVTIAPAHPSLVITLASTGGDAAFDLVPDTTTATRTIGKIGWQRYTGRVTAEGAGIGTFVFQDPAHLPAWLEAPTVVSSMMAARHEPPGRVVPTLAARAPSAGEAKALKAMAAWRRRRLGGGAHVPSGVQDDVDPAALRRRLLP
jgi:hypothetical protein